MQNIFKAKSRRFLSLIGMIAFVAIVGLSSVSCVINVPDDTPNHSLNGTWETEDGFIVEIIGRTGYIKQFSSGIPSAIVQSAINKGFVHLDDQVYRNLTEAGYLKWSGQILLYNRYDYAPNDCVGVNYYNVTITMSENGKTIEAYFPDSVGSKYSTLTRRR
ncbi:MAG: hypothetical protein LBU82_02045, partial [Treponema sp.]|jgi:hypothetical protein|nr:hypothetical protein [Treponema sp.]